MVRSVVQSCPLLVELELIDVPKSVDQLVDELSDEGVQSLVGCRHLTSLFLVRSQQRLLDSPFGYKTAIPFRDITDMGMTLLSEGCKRLESVRLDWFSEVTNAGFTSILSSCLNLKKFEIHNSSHLTDLAFIDVSKVQRPLVEVKLVYCKSITCKGVGELAMTGNLIEVLNLPGCQHVADSCLSSVSYLTSLTSLNLGSTNVTDDGMDVLGKGNAPISYLSLRGCSWVTDEGITSLLGNKGKISKTLSSLDLGYMQRISDNVVTIIADACAGLVQLCIRNCLLVTDEAVKTLDFRGRLQHESKLLRRLDIISALGYLSNRLSF